MVLFRFEFFFFFLFFKQQLSYGVFFNLAK